MSGLAIIGIVSGGVILLSIAFMVGVTAGKEDIRESFQNATIKAVKNNTPKVAKLITLVEGVVIHKSQVCLKSLESFSNKHNRGVLDLPSNE